MRRQDVDRSPDGNPIEGADGQPVPPEYRDWDPYVRKAYCELYDLLGAAATNEVSIDAEFGAITQNNGLGTEEAKVIRALAQAQFTASQQK